MGTCSDFKGGGGDHFAKDGDYSFALGMKRPTHHLVIVFSIGNDGLKVNQLDSLDFSLNEFFSENEKGEPKLPLWFDPDGWNRS